MIKRGIKIAGHGDNAPMLIDHWPLLGLRLITPRLELRLPIGEELGDLADLAAEGMHDPGSRPFLVSWPALPATGPLTWPFSLMDRSWASRISRPVTFRSCARSAPSPGSAYAITARESAPRCALPPFTSPSPTTIERPG